MKVIFPNPLNDFLSGLMEPDCNGRGQNFTRFFFETAGKLLKLRVLEEPEPIKAVHLALGRSVSNQPAHSRARIRLFYQKTQLPLFMSPTEEQGRDIQLPRSNHESAGIAPKPAQITTKVSQEPNFITGSIQ
jgi:hypothetical protein